MAPALLSWLWVWWPGHCRALQDTRQSRKPGGKTAVQGDLRTAVRGEQVKTESGRGPGICWGGCLGGAQSQSHTRDPSKYSGTLCHSSRSKQTIKMGPRAPETWDKPSHLCRPPARGHSPSPDHSYKDSAFKNGKGRLAILGRKNI